MTSIAKNIIQTNILDGKILKVCLNPFFINLNHRRQKFILETKTKTKLQYNTLPIHSFVEKNKIITSIYKPNLMEYLLYSPVNGEIININYNLLNDLNNVFTKTYQHQDVIDKLCIVEIEVENTAHYFTGYH